MSNRLDAMIRRGAAEGVKTLRSICADGEKRDADRIAAAKVLLDYGIKKDNPDGSETMRVILENVPEEYLT